MKGLKKAGGLGCFLMDCFQDDRAFLGGRKHQGIATLTHSAT